MQEASGNETLTLRAVQLRNILTLFVERGTWYGGGDQPFIAFLPCRVHQRCRQLLSDRPADRWVFGFCLCISVDVVVIQIGFTIDHFI